jgi:hypothetical protein
MTEQWRPVVGYEGLYEVSDHGRVRSVERIVPHATFGTVKRKSVMLRQSLTNKGYSRVVLAKCGSNLAKNVHRLVADAFLGPRPEWSTQVNHKNKSRTDNRSCNLEWSSNSHNGRHRYAKYEHNGRLLSCSDLAEMAGINPFTMHSRLEQSGWSVEQAVSTPVRRAA